MTSYLEQKGVLCEDEKMRNFTASGKKKIQDLKLVAGKAF